MITTATAASSAILGFGLHPPYSQPATEGRLTVTSSLSSFTLRNALSNGSYPMQASSLSDDRGQRTIVWTAATGLQTGLYLLVDADGSVSDSLITLHDGYTVFDCALRSGGSSLAVAGKQEVLLTGGFYYSTDVIVRFSDSTQSIDVPGALNGGNVSEVVATSPGWETPADWYAGCQNTGNSSGLQRFVSSATCVPPLPVSVSVSLDGGATFAVAPRQLSYNYVAPLKVVFYFFGEITDFGWTYAQNVGKLWIEPWTSGPAYQLNQN
jgi:hypothetical protein